MEPSAGDAPIRRSARQLLADDGFYRQRREFAVPVAQLRSARDFPDLPGWESAGPIVERAMTAILADDVSVGAALKTVETLVGEMLLAPPEPDERRVLLSQ